MLGNESSTTAPPPEYYTLPQALDALRAKLVAVTIEEIAGWIFMDSLSAYRDVKELNPPPRFNFPTPDRGYYELADYKTILAACYILKSDIAAFVPTDRYINGDALIKRWSGLPGVSPEAFISAKIRESKSNAEPRLLIFHPIYSLSSAHFGDDFYPPLNDCLCSFDDIREIETQDFPNSQKLPDFFVEVEETPEVTICNNVPQAVDIPDPVQGGKEISDLFNKHVNLGGKKKPYSEKQVIAILRNAGVLPPSQGRGTTPPLVASRAAIILCARQHK